MFYILYILKIIITYYVQIYVKYMFDASAYLLII